MFNAKLYNQANEMQRKEAQNVMEEFARKLKWRSDGKDSLLDVGSGSGDVTFDFVLPKMPKDFKKLVCSDISEKMVQHARSNYNTCSKISFEKLDIAGDVTEFLDNHPEGFDHITSFYCLHWENDQQKVLRNIYDLLSWKGDCGLMFLANCEIFNVYVELAQNKKWAPYMVDIDHPISPYQNAGNPTDEYSRLLKMAGFSNYNVQYVARRHVYDNLSTFKRNMMAVNPFVLNMTMEQREEYFQDLLSVAVRLGMVRSKDTQNDFEAVLRYSLLIVYASK